MPPSAEKSDTAKVVGESKSSPTPKGKPGASPFVGEVVTIFSSLGADHNVDGKVFDLVDGFLGVRDEEDDVHWINLRYVSAVSILAPDAPDTDPAGVDTADMLANLAAFKANPGPLEDTGS